MLDRHNRSRRFDPHLFDLRPLDFRSMATIPAAVGVVAIVPAVNAPACAYHLRKDLKMSATDNAAIARLTYDLWNQRDLEGEVALSDPDIEIINVATGKTYRGADELREFLTEWATAFPDARVEVTHMVADERGAVVEFTARGTHSGPLVGPSGEIPATGRAITIQFCDVFEMRDGKFVRQRTYFDLATMMRQLGLIP